MAFKRRRFSRGSSVTRRKSWDRWIATSSGTQSTGSPGASGVQVGWIDEPHGRLMADASGLIRQVDETVLRMLVNFDITCREDGVVLSNTPAYATGWVSAGLLVWEGLDGTSTPSLLDVPWPVSGSGPGEEADWLWTYKRAFASLPVFGSTHENEALLSSRAKRKLSSGAGILLITEVFCFEFSVTYDWSANGRQLSALP